MTFFSLAQSDALFLHGDIGFKMVHIFFVDVLRFFIFESRVVVLTNWLTD